MIFSSKLTTAGLILAALAASHFQAYTRGSIAGQHIAFEKYAQSTAKMQAAFDTITAANRAAAARIDALKTTQATLAREAEYAAQNDTSTCRTPSAHSVQRLKKRWGGH